MASGKSVLVATELDADGALRPVSLETLTAGRQVADATGGDLVAVVVGNGVGGAATQVAALGANRVLVADDARLAGLTAESMTAALAAAIAAVEPFAVIVPGTTLGRDAAPRLAARLATGLAADCVGFAADGDALVATARLAHFFGADVRAVSPASADVAELAAAGIAAIPIDHRAPPPLRGDRWTAFTLLFHDHEWEEVLLPWALRQPHLHVGAIGGAQSRRDRLRMLREKGFRDSTLEHFRTPAGLIPATRDPATLALSVIAQIVAAYQAEGPGAQKRATETVSLYD